ncbi:Uncharacterized protein FWK35_00032266, partial [Aphis craccivora]
TIRTTHKETCIKFSKIIYNDYFLNYNHIKKSILSKTGFAVFPDAFENYWTIFAFDPPMYQLDSRADFLKLKEFYCSICGDRHKKKTHIIVKSLHLSLRSEYKTKNFERSDECIDLTMLCFYVSMYTKTSRNNASIFNLSSFFGSKVNLVRAFGRSFLKYPIVFKSTVMFNFQF